MRKSGQIKLYLFTFIIILYFLKSLQNLGKLFNLIFPITVHKNNAFSKNLIFLSTKKPNVPFFGSEEVFFGPKIKLSSSETPVVNKITT
jgi:hypothetical protein